MLHSRQYNILPMGLPSDLVRSVEVHVVNQTKFLLTVESSSLSGNCKWIDRETPVKGDNIQMFNDVVWGVYTWTEEGSGNGLIALIGLGNGPVSIGLQIDPNSKPTCTFSGNNALIGTVNQVDSGDGDSGPFQILQFQLLLTSPAV